MLLVPLQQWILLQHFEPDLFTDCLQIQCGEMIIHTCRASDTVNHSWKQNNRHSKQMDHHSSNKYVVCIKPEKTYIRFSSPPARLNPSRPNAFYLMKSEKWLLYISLPKKCLKDKNGHGLCNIHPNYKLNFILHLYIIGYTLFPSKIK